MINWRIKNADFLPDYSVKIEFMDGKHGTIKFAESFFSNIFTPLRDIKLFLTGYIKYGAITWDTGELELDLAPDAMYERIQNNNGVDILQ
ncbi:MAG: DUF2442 domain-containing protein [Burkholderiales bacterium]|nr:DUF2442 domain-containing protein [Burkholderiales bacterium]